MTLPPAVDGLTSSPVTVAAFPKECTVHVTPRHRVKGASKVAVHMSGAEFRQAPVEEAIRYYGKRLHRILIADLPEEIGFIEAHPSIIFVFSVSIRDISAVESHLDTWRSARTVFQLQSDGRLLRTANYLTSSGFPVQIPFAAFETNRGQVQGLLDFYFHNRELSSPIQPFHSLFKAACAKRPTTFWQIASEDVDRNFYIAPDGQISLSAMWRDAGYVYGNVKDTFESILQAQGRKDLARMVQPIENPSPPCRGCPILSTCRGYLIVHEAPESCDVWRQACDLILRRADKIKSIIAELRHRNHD